MKVRVLRRERKKQNMTQAELARRMGISRGLVCQIEKGWRKPYPKFLRNAETILSLAEKELKS